MNGQVNRIKTSAPYGAARNLKNRLAAFLFERGLTDTGVLVELEDLGLHAPDRVRYQASGWSFLRRALRRCEIRPTDVFVDFGSGKGRVLWQAAHYPFARVVGIEISPQLNEVAARNIEPNLHRLTCRDIELITADATEAEIPDDMTFAYLYSPFEGETFRCVLRRIIESLDRAPRRLTVIYANPVMDAEVRSSGRFELAHVIRGIRPDTRKANRVHIYVSSDGAGGNGDRRDGDRR